MGPSNVTNSSKSTCPSPAGHRGDRHSGLMDMCHFPALQRVPMGASGGDTLDSVMLRHTPLRSLGGPCSKPQCSSGGHHCGDTLPQGCLWGPCSRALGGLRAPRSCPSTHNSLEQQLVSRCLGHSDFSSQGPPNWLGTPSTNEVLLTREAQNQPGTLTPARQPNTSWGPPAKLRVP